VAEKGQISIHTDNILPIIKKWLYAEKDIYFRELVSNASDALTKLGKLALTGDAEDAREAEITVEIDKEKGTLTISDTGLGMNAEEIKKYINQIAFSGVSEFVEKYQDKDESSQIIGHFGLGFYSSFMVSDKVEIHSLSYKKGSEAVHWSCTGETDFSLEKGERQQVGTSVILHINDESKEMLDEYKIRSLIDRYCAFVRHPIKLGKEVLNETKPLWTKSPANLNDDDYRKFFRKLFPTSPEPLFWVHLNVDYPFNLRGVLYFPKFSHQFEATEGQVKLYCNQVFVADNCKELIPEYLTVLKGIIDIPDLPLNVSRSYLQNEPQIKKISEHITKKIADKFIGMSKTEPEKFIEFWKDIHPFVKYCMMRDEKFSERLSEHMIFRSTTGEYTTLDAYLERMSEKTENKIIYISDETSQAHLAQMYRDQGLEAILADSPIDRHFIPYFEMKSDKKYNFQRIDADLSAHLKDSEGASEIVDPKDQKTKSQRIADLFKEHLSLGDVEIEVSNLKSQKLAAMLVVGENERRMKEMAQYMPLGDLASLAKSKEMKLIVNSACPAIDNLLKLAAGISKEAEVKLIVEQIHDLAQMQHGDSGPELMQKVLDRSIDIMSRIH
jgi:molecular chaperone HtpG